MNKLKSFSGYAIAYLMWIVSFLLWLVFMLIGREMLNGMLGLYYIGESFQRVNSAKMFDRIFMLGTGLIWVVLMIAVENYFRRGVAAGDLWRRIGRVIGPQVLLIFVVDILKAVFVDPTPVYWLRWVICAAELIFGVGVVWLSYRRQPVNPPVTSLS